MSQHIPCIHYMRVGVGHELGVKFSIMVDQQGFGMDYVPTMAPICVRISIFVSPISGTCVSSSADAKAPGV